MSCVKIEISSNEFNEFLQIKVEQPDISDSGDKSEFDVLPSTLAVKVETGQNVFSCSQCDLAFTSAQLLKKHTRKRHEGHKFPCSFCAFSAKDNSYLKKHQSLVHNGKGRDHMCPHCDKTFTTVNHLENHIRTHTGEKPFVCNVCAKGFGQKQHLTTHLLIHSGERPFACKECGQRFNRPSHLKLHQRIHTGEKPYKCKWCEKKFSISSNRTAHQRIHTGEKPYTCKWCDKRFNQSTALTKHERIHTGEKPYTCKWCDKRFNQSTALTKHERIHTGEKPFEMASNQLVLKVEPQEICEKSVSELDVQLAPQEQDQDVFGCSQCDLAFTSDQLLQQHTTRAHEGQKFPCCSCSYVEQLLLEETRTTGALLHRVRGGNHMCPHCNKTFNNVAHLNDHIETHTGKITVLVQHVCKEVQSEKKSQETPTHSLKRTRQI